jgi:hypothetical protein
MPRWFSVAFDIGAIAVLGFAIYFPRYRRQDLLLSYVVLNIGVLAVTIALASAEVGIGVGFGLFGVLSIVRLRSSELAQQEVAYCFAALTLGLLNGVIILPELLAPALSIGIVAALFIVDHPRVHPRYRNQVMTLDRAFTDEVALTAFLEETLRAPVSHLVVKRVDLVNDTTIVDVRFRLPKVLPGADIAESSPSLRRSTEKTIA